MPGDSQKSYPAIARNKCIPSSKRKRLLQPTLRLPLENIDRCSKVARSIEGALEDHAGEFDMMDMGSTLHEGSDEIVNEEVDGEFGFDHLQVQTKQDIHA